MLSFWKYSYWKCTSPGEGVDNAPIFTSIFCKLTIAIIKQSLKFPNDWFKIMRILYVYVKIYTIAFKKSNFSNIFRSFLSIILKYKVIPSKIFDNSKFIRFLYNNLLQSYRQHKLTSQSINKTQINVRRDYYFVIFGVLTPKHVSKTYVKNCKFKIWSISKFPTCNMMKK